MAMFLGHVAALNPLSRMSHAVASKVRSTYHSLINSLVKVKSTSVSIEDTSTPERQPATIRRATMRVALTAARPVHPSRPLRIRVEIHPRPPSIASSSSGSAAPPTPPTPPKPPAPPDPLPQTVRAPRPPPPPPPIRQDICRLRSDIVAFPMYASGDRRLGPPKILTHLVRPELRPNPTLTTFRPLAPSTSTASSALPAPPAPPMPPAQASRPLRPAGPPRLRHSPPPSPVRQDIDLLHAELRAHPKFASRERGVNSPAPLKQALEPQLRPTESPPAPPAQAAKPSRPLGPQRPRHPPPPPPKPPRLGQVKIEMPAYPKYAWTEPLPYAEKHEPARVLSAADAASARALNMASLQAQLAAAIAKRNQPMTPHQARLLGLPAPSGQSHDEPVSRQPEAPTPATAQAKKNPSPFGPTSLDRPVLPAYAEAFVRQLTRQHPMVKYGVRREFARISMLNPLTKYPAGLNNVEDLISLPPPSTAAANRPAPKNAPPTLWFTTQQLFAIKTGKELPHIAAYRAEYWADRRAELRAERRAERDIAQTEELEAALP